VTQGQASAIWVHRKRTLQTVSVAL